MKTKLRIFWSIILVLLMMGCKKEPYYTLKGKTKEYIAFFGKGSWWKYQIEGTSDTVVWEATNYSLSTFDYGNSKGDYCQTNIKTDITDIGFQTKAKSNQDVTSSGFGQIYSDDITIKGLGDLLLEDNIVVNGIIYNEVLHISKFDFYPYEDIWIVPNVGVIKVKTREGVFYTLTNYKIISL